MKVLILRRKKSNLAQAFALLLLSTTRQRRQLDADTAQKQQESFKRDRLSLQGEIDQANTRTSALHVVTLYQSRELRMIGAAFRHWHSTTFREHMQQTVTQLRSEASRALHRAHEATAEQVAARRAGMLRGLITRQLRFKMSKGFEGLRQAAWAGQNQVAYNDFVSICH